jgi:anti-sigma regulatory factor (Ser/Thr protein kinase)
VKADRLELVVPGRAEYLRHIRGWCEALMRDQGFGRRPIQEFTLALSEACANTIEHGLGMDPRKHLRLECAIERSRFRIAIVNFCRPDDLPRIKARRLDDVRPRGLGTHLIARTSDAVRYEPNEDGGIRLILTKRRRRRSARRPR